MRPNESLSLNLATLLALARSTTTPIDEFDTTNCNDDLKEALAEAFADERKQSAKNAARDIISLLQSAKAKEESLVEEIRALRRKEVELKSVLGKIKGAREYAQVSNNYLPLLKCTTAELPRHFYTDPKLKELLEVKTVLVSPTTPGPERKKITLIKKTKPDAV